MSEDRARLIVFCAVAVVWIYGVLWLFVGRRSRTLFGGVAVIHLLVSVAWVLLGLPYWIFTVVALSLIAGVSLLRALRSGTGRVPSIVCFVGSSIAAGVTWLLAGAPFWQYTAAACTLMAAGIVALALRRRDLMSRLAREAVGGPASPPRYKYLYWSARRLAAAFEDGGLARPRQVKAVLQSPQLPFAPNLQVESSTQPATRHDLAETLRERLTPWTVEIGAAADEPPRTRTASYLAGRGTLAFNEFRGAESQGLDRLAIGYSAVETRDGSRVAICLFCSMDNFVEFLQNSDPGVARGWAWSSAPAIARFVRQAGARGPGREPGEGEESADAALAIEVLKHAVDRRDVRPGEAGPWSRRPFTFAEVKDDAEWLAEVYIDVADERSFTISTPANGDQLTFDRIIVGAPVWVRTARIRSVRLNDEYSELEIDRDYDREARRIHRVKQVLASLGLTGGATAQETRDQRPAR